MLTSHFKENQPMEIVTLEKSQFADFVVAPKLRHQLPGNFL
jgi:hypothetical protein